ncbi:acyloxyacyl hydrolase [Aromatoleum evansii]|uniref:Lipid A deacylase n=1 Tax=Aromatoleum evansii TaxID=59406 RepID=A0ABZ1AM52_AROEV|nr:acyloxyacyl hydrolase [Aromatoleum evansii]NMG31391.1 outer membrane beta-barrel protein [Aromatoleum evansii]WRL46101.1 acyloxyacyl hydrolase [Aromatoleum evansii]
MKFLACVATAVLAAGGALAAEPAVSVFHGEHDNYERTGLSVRLGPLWGANWGTWHAGVHPELELSRFHYSGSSRGPNTLNQAGAVGLLRMVRGQGNFQPYAELGLGAALLSRTDLGPKVFSTAFQFSQHAGLGIEFAGRYTVGWRYSHYSNGDVEMPNDGIDLHQLVIGASF